MKSNKLPQVMSLESAEAKDYKFENETESLKMKNTWRAAFESSSLPDLGITLLRSA